MKNIIKNVFFVSTVSLFAISLLSAGDAVSATKKPMTVAEIALYKGADRQQMLEEGAKKEGTLVFYTSGQMNQAVRPILDSFEKKYPYIKVKVWRAGSEALVPRIFEEFKSGKLACDVIENTQTGYMHMQRQGGILQSFTSPHFAFMEDDAITKASGGGAFRVSFRESGHGIGYNTKLLTRENLPKTYRDLLDPKWKGKVALAGSVNGVSFAGNMLDYFGLDFVKKLASQNFDVHMVSARAVLDMVINGEYLLSPTIVDAHVGESKKKGAPVDWIPIEPVHVNAGQIAITTQSLHPYAAMLFIDHELSKESGEIHKAKGYISPRKDVLGEKTYKKDYGPYTLEQSRRWEDTFRTFFLKK